MHTSLSSEALLSLALGDRNSKISGSEGKPPRPLIKQKKEYLIHIELILYMHSYNLALLAQSGLFVLGVYIEKNIRSTAF